MVKDYRTHLQKVWRETHQKWEEVYDPYYFRTYKVWDGKGQEDYGGGWLRHARSTSIVDHAVDHQLSAEPQVERFPVREGEEHQKNADLVENGLAAIFQEAALLESVLTWKMMSKHLIHYGYAVHELDLDSEVLARRADEPERNRGESDDEFEGRNRLFQHYRRSAMPFRTRAPHPSDILMDPTEKQPRIAIKHVKMYSAHLYELTRTKKERGRKVDVWEKGDNPWEEILVDICWTEKWHALMVAGNEDFWSRTFHFKQGQLLFVEPNTWGFVPYAHAFGNFGMQPTAASGRGPSALAVGILDPVIPDLHAQAQAIAARHNILIDASFNPILVKGMGADELRDQLDKGRIIEVNEEGTVRRMELAQLPRWMFQSEEWYGKDIEEGTVARVLAGIREPGVITVGQHAMIHSAAAKKFLGVSKQMEHLASVACSQILQMIDMQDFDLTIRGHRIKPEYIEHDYSVQVHFDVIDPMIQAQQRELELKEVELGIRSDETYRSSGARIADESGEQKRLLRQWIRKLPPVHQALAMEVAREEGTDRLLQRAMALAAGQGAAPVNGNAAPSGLLGPDGQPLASSMGQMDAGLEPATLGQNGTNLEG